MLLDSTSRSLLPEHGLSLEALRQTTPSLLTARISPFGDTGPWGDWKASDLIHLALGGPMMNSGYDPKPDLEYDVSPIAPQMWQAYHIAGEQMAMMICAALVQRQRTGLGQHLSCAVHEAVSKCTELDLMSWVMRRIPFYRQTCRHAAVSVSQSPTISHTKDGRWILAQPVVKEKVPELLEFLAAYGMDEPLRADFERTVPDASFESQQPKGRYIPGSSQQTDLSMRCQEALQRLFAKFTFENAPWAEAQEAGILVAPLRPARGELADPHWRARKTFAELEHPELGTAFTYVTAKWMSDRTSWVVGRRAPRLDEDADEIRRLGPSRAASALPEPLAQLEKPFPLAGIRIFDFSWFLASAGGTRFLAALGAECIKVEWKSNPDSRLARHGARRRPGCARCRDRPARGDRRGRGATTPQHGRAVQRQEPRQAGHLAERPGPPGPRDRQAPDLDVRHRGRGVLARRPGALGSRLRRPARAQARHHLRQAVGHGLGRHLRPAPNRRPRRAAFAGTSEMSGLAEPAASCRMGILLPRLDRRLQLRARDLSALYHRNATGQGQ